MGELATTLTHLDRLIACPTVSADSNLDAIGYIAGVLEAAGARVEILRDAGGTKANLWATLGPEVSGGLVLSGHTDVVPVTDQDWTTDPFRMEEREGRVYGRGTCDMKGFIAACLAMAPRLARAAVHRPIHFAFTHDEEVGCLGARALVEELARRDIRPALALIGEPTLMQVIEGHKGCCEYTVRFKGVGGHGSAPAQGVNAVEYAARYMAHLMELRRQLKARAPADSPFDPPETTINIGALHGGYVHNVIPSLATLSWEMRPVTREDMDFVKSSVAALVRDSLLPEMRRGAPGTGIETEVIGEVVGLEPMPENRLRDTVLALTGANGASCVPFGTEAGLLQGLGMQTIVCGPGAIEQAHKPDEFIALDQLSQCLSLLDRLAEDHAAH